MLLTSMRAFMSLTAPSSWPAMRYFSSPSRGTSRYFRSRFVASHKGQNSGALASHVFSQTRHSHRPHSLPIFQRRCCHLSWMVCPSSKMFSWTWLCPF